MPVSTPIRQSTYGTMDGVPYVEHNRNPRRLVLCFDGTANLFDETNTNVVRLVSYLKKDDLQEQQVYYQTGVGTYIKPGWMMPMTVQVMQTLDEGFAWDLSSHIIGGYKFLMQNWTPGSKISIFGFSRGAYTARALAGMLHKVGLLSRGNEEQIPFAFKMYQNQAGAGWDMSDGFKNTFCHYVRVDFLGVWDTVASVGVFNAKDLPFSASDHDIRVFRHAISLDERRCKFKANLWQQPFIPPNSDTVGGNTDGPKALSYHPLNGHGAHDSIAEEQDDAGSVDMFFEEHNGRTDVEEVWFSGGHGDVGGGNVKNKTRSSANRIPLTWMIREIVLANTGIVFDEAALSRDGISLPVPNPALTATGKNADGSMETETVLAPENYISKLDGRYSEDALAPTSDQLVLKWAWWILEIMPFTYRIQSKKGGPDQWKLSPWPNNGGPRATPDGRMKVHISVRERMEKGNYQPKVKWTQEPEWVN
ncbi:hypothetical protein CALVIDRAFT_599948 [Calocera viscosa TUFC12733]|uniref:T6SS Phospholipase effector Tle1-like catalytic domain-containing protein n=1 Tax=Calocera viscosa (strain TUFC12733) TaxID=1330018 RepID=A0A167KF36_CALVF|nr:hypothetical protein CALVIDRAFT_599948 [Calocera viscosa TUFC12733]